MKENGKNVREIFGIEKRGAILFARITPTNKKFLAKESRKWKLSEAQVVELAIFEFRKRIENRDRSSKSARKHA